jgi:hypothetical protein
MTKKLKNIEKMQTAELYRLYHQNKTREERLLKVIRLRFEEERKPIQVLMRC